MFLQTHQSELRSWSIPESYPLTSSCDSHQRAPEIGELLQRCPIPAAWLWHVFLPKWNNSTAVWTGLLCSPCPHAARDQDSCQGFTLVPSQPVAVNLFTSLSMGNLIQNKKCVFLFFSKCMDFSCTPCRVCRGLSVNKGRELLWDGPKHHGYVCNMLYHSAVQNPRPSSGAVLVQASAELGSSPLKTYMLYLAKPMCFNTSVCLSSLLLFRVV